MNDTESSSVQSSAQPMLDEAKFLAVTGRRDFAAEQTQNQRLTLLLLIIFPILIVALGWAIGEWVGGYTEIGIAGALIVAAGFMLGAWFGGDKLILGMAGARQADPSLDARVVNVVEEMAIASGLPVPKVYVIETDALNAFATGRDPEKATVAVTRGLVTKLNREELQAVVAHELGHVRNFDIRYAMLVAAMVGAIVLLADGLRRSMWWGSLFGGRRRGGGDRGGGAQAIIMLVILLLAILAPVFAVMVQMAVSRKREFLADATAVELTRNPIALASALSKIDNTIEALPPGAKNRALQHLYIVNPLAASGPRSSALFSTHPSIDERIKRLKAMV